MSIIPESDVFQRLCSCEKETDWESLSQFLQPKYFQNDRNVSTKLLAKVAQILTNSNPEIPTKTKIHLLKCLVNSCIHTYKYKSYYLKRSEMSKYETELYGLLSEDPNFTTTLEINKTYPIKTHFPYDGVSQWTVDTVLQFVNQTEKLSNEELDILTQCIQFLSNFVSLACKSASAPELEDPPTHLEQKEFKNAILILIGHEHIPVARAACVFVYNTITQSDKDYISAVEESLFMKHLIKASRVGINIASDVILFLIQKRKILPKIYDDLLIDDRLYVLQIIHENLLKESDYHLPSETTKLLTEKFRKKSDLILKTVDTYLDGMQPMEVMILLDILGILTSKTDSTSVLLREDRSLLINGLYLLKSIHMVGKESNNYFTPLQKLSDVAPSMQGTNVSENENSDEIKNLFHKDFQTHPAYGFKAGLIRLIGNLVFENKNNQDFIREEEGIPLLLDCCNIDARNPLLIQWVILAMKNLCNGNKDNQKVIQECTKIGVVDSAALKEMGLTLHEEDGKAIGIMPML